MSAASDTMAVILAGGQARRMGGGDKCLINIDGSTILAHQIKRLKSSVDTILLNANGDVDRFKMFGLPVAADVIEGFGGPLVGIVTGLLWARENRPDMSFVVSIAGDTPFFPKDLTRQLIKAGQRDPQTIVLASSNGRVHPVFGLWPVALADDLKEWLLSGSNPKVLAFVDRYTRIEVPFEVDAYDPFFNINTPEDVSEAERLAGAHV